MESRGIIYIAIGDEYRSMAVRSAESIVSNYVGECPQISILSDSTHSFRVSPHISIQEIRLKYPADPSIATAYLKCRLNYLSEFAETLYLDCDTKAIGDISGIWEQVGDSIAVSPAYNPIKEGTFYPNDLEASVTSKCLSEIDNYTQYNTGVLLFRDNLYVDKVFELWLKEWHTFQYHENMAFARITTKGIKVDALNSKYNQFYSDVEPDTVLVHYIGGYKKYLKF